MTHLALTSCCCLILLVFGRSALAACSAEYFSLPADTIIIDGEYITISKKEVQQDLDSLEAISNKDLKKKRIGSLPFITNIQLGNALSRATFASTMPRYEPLDNFVNQKVSARNSLIGQFSIGYPFAQIPLRSWKLECSAHLGVGYGMYKFGTIALNRQDMLQDSLIKLEYEQESLKLIYFNITGTGPDGEILGELDSVNVRTYETVHRLRTLDIPFKFRFDLCKAQDQSWSILLDVGIVVRRLSSRSFEPAFLVNERGEFKELYSRELATQRLVGSPLAAVGFSMRLGNLSEGGMLSHARAGFVFQSELSSVHINPGNIFAVRIENHSFMLFLSYRF